MSGKNKGTALRNRLAAAAEKKIEGGSVSYSLSSAAAAQIRRRLWGDWIVAEHALAGESYLDRFAARTLGDLEVADLEYRAEYRFKEHLCLKFVEIRGTVAGEDGPSAYRYRLAMAGAWDLEGPGLLSIRPELGYQSTELGGALVAFKELEAQDSLVVTNFRLEEGALILEEGEDRKRLERLR